MGKCEVCGVPVEQRFHDGRWVCAEHKSTPIAEGTSSVPRPLSDDRSRIEALSGAVAALGDLRTSHERSASHAGQAIVRANEVATQLAMLASRVDGHEQRVNATEAAVGSTKTLLGDFFSKADGETQATMLCDKLVIVTAQVAAAKTEREAMSARIAALESALSITNDNHQMLAARASKLSVGLEAHTTQSFWQRLLWLWRGVPTKDTSHA